MISRAATGLPLSSSSPYLASPLSSRKSSPPKTFQHPHQQPLPRPHLDLGFSKDSLPPPGVPTSSLFLRRLLYFPPPVFRHTLSVTLNLIIPCPATCDPLCLVFPLPLSPLLSSLRLQMNPLVASTFSPLPFPSTYLPDKSWSQWSPACCL